MNDYARRTIPADSGKLVLYTGVSKGDNQPDAPTGAQLLAAVSEAARTPVERHDEKLLATRLMERPAQPGKITAEEHDKALGLTRLTLSNGVK
ncbi:hypothetical protein LTR94_037351, partial [Friedmanniomyces endolithicus]